MINWTVREIRDAVNTGKMTAVEVVTEALHRIKITDEEVGAFLEVFREEALTTAAQIDDRIKSGEKLPLAGVPVAIKDNILMTGHVASAGSKMLQHYTAAYTSTVVKRLQEAGAIIVGRTNMDEFAMGSSTETSAFHKTKNPLDLTKNPGGSSGGSAAAVAAKMVPAAFGTDTGGSIRQPAAFCGVVGMKPTYGRISRHGIIALSSSLDQIGPIATTVEDIAILLKVVEGRDSYDATSVELKKSEETNDPIKKLRIGVPKEFFIEGMDEELSAVVKLAIEKLKKIGATVVEVSLPLLAAALPAYYIIQPAEASSNLARFDGMRYGDRGEGTLEESYRQARGKGFGAEVKRRIMLELLFCQLVITMLIIKKL